MPPTPGTFNAYTAPINPPNASPILTSSQVWTALEQKVQHAEWFVSGALKSTNVLSTTTNSHGQRVTTREVVFVEGDKKIKEVCTEIPPIKVEFAQPGGGVVCNIVSEGGDGELYMTYTFEYLHEGAGEEEMKETLEKRRKMAKLAVEGTIEAIREMVRDGRIK